MGRWYRGRVTGYNPASCQHEIVYSDGDLQWLDLKREAVMWLDVPGLQRREEIAQHQGLPRFLETASSARPTSSTSQYALSFADPSPLRAELVSQLWNGDYVQHALASQCQHPV